MKKAVRNLAVAAGLSLSILACEGDTPVETTASPEEDKALALSVMSARGDTLGAAVEQPPIEDGFEDVTAGKSPPQRIRRARVSAPTPARAPNPVAPAPRIAVQRRSSAESRPLVSDRVAPLPKRTESARSRTGTIKSGAALAVFTNGKVCSNEGTFRAVVSHTVRGNNGAVIPAGAQATVEITSVDKWGAGIGVRVTSVRFDGNSYPVSSRTVYVLPEKEGCIPAQARIEVETKESLTVEALN